MRFEKKLSLLGLAALALGTVAVVAFSYWAHAWADSVMPLGQRMDAVEERLDALEMGGTR